VATWRQADSSTYEKKVFDLRPALYGFADMKIALLHYTFWPDIGGVEQVMRDQAAMLQREGHEVKVISGTGSDSGDFYEVQVLPELAPDFPLNAQVRAVLERGQADQNFNRYRAVLIEVLQKALADVDLTLVHNVFTMHHNLVLTRALHDLATKHRLIAWTHDVAANNSDYALPNPTQAPWKLMRMSHPQVAYVATSGLRAAEIQEHLAPEVAVEVIPNMVDPNRLFALTPELRASYTSLDLPARDFIFLLPASALPRKNLDFPIAVVKQLWSEGRDPLLLITGGSVPNNSSSKRYGDFLRQSLPEDLKGHVVFVSDFFPVTDEILRDLYLLSDCLFYPSRQEGFGLPIIEAASYRLPIWCQDVPAYQALADEKGACLLTNLSKLPEAVAWLEDQATFRQQRLSRRLFDPSVIYRDYFEPLLASFTEAAATEHT
jgi:glycosyltransferase involved in cell wall biosynthesis